MNLAGIWVVEAGVLLNLAAIEGTDRLFAKLGMQLLTPAVELKTILRSPRTRRRAKDLAELGLPQIEAVSLTPAEEELLVEFASPACGLHDSEAAMLAIAKSRDASCLLDDPRALRIVRELSSVRVLTTTGLFRALLDSGQIPRPLAETCLWDAAHWAGMSVPYADRQWLANLLGVERASRLGLPPQT